MTGKKFSFTTFRQIREFIESECKFWADANKSLPENINADQNLTKLNYLQEMVNIFNSWDAKMSTWDDTMFNSQFRNLQQQQLNQLRSDWLWHGHSYIQNWLELHTRSQFVADAFLNTILNRKPSTITQSVDHMIGHILAYEYLLQGSSDIPKRAEAERVSILQLQDELILSKNKLVEEVDSLISRTENWGSEKKEYLERFYNIRKKLFERLVNQQKKEFSDELNKWNENIKALESTYEEKLRLKKPAEYWKKASIKYRYQGGLFAVLIFVFVLLGLLFFHNFYLAWALSENAIFSLSSMQGVLIFGTSVAIYAFLLRVISRLTFSSFHLMRDAEEREQLTYLYLSLSENSSVDENARILILQALFSRTETGLLAQENGPSMPGFADALRFASKAKQ